MAARGFADYIDTLAIEVEMVEPQSIESNIARDAGDLPILGTLLAAQADYLITGDDDLITFADRCSIVSPSDFWRKRGS